MTAAIAVFEKKRKESLSWKSYAIFFSAFTFYSFFAAWQDEHRNTGQVIAEKSALASTSSSCQVDLKATQGALRDKESVADSLQRVFIASQVPQQQQAANIASCINNLAKMNPIIDSKISVFELPHAFTGDNAIVIITTNRSHSNPVGNLSCDNPFHPTYPLQMAEPGNGVVTRSNPIRISDRNYEVRFSTDTGEWSSNNPLYAQLAIDTASGLGKCHFIPQ